MIAAGYWLIPNELGVRLFFILATTGGVYILEKLLSNRDRPLFYAIVLSVVSFQVGTIIAAPDAPVFFLAVTFLYLFRRFLEEDNFVITLLLAVNTAMMLYAKYTGIIVISLSFLYNFRVLIKRPHTWLWFVLSLLLFMPHMWWQWTNDFPSFRFHLTSRPGRNWFNITNMLDFIPGQLLISGPIAGFFFFYSLFLVKPKNRFERTLRFNVAGIYLFF